MIYLDASAMVTFIVRRPHAEPLKAFLASRPTRTCTSTIGFVETVRTCDQVGTFPNLMASLLRDHDEIRLTDAIRDAAANVPGTVRSLDAIHIASAEHLGSELTALITYDVRMAEAARLSGLPVAMPGTA
ncbi:MAG TPA: type II toxin-antitoxin system VapC family toxin [Pseudonocardiaceae bacterium]|nr:type II toxin-antitoxin system VapC family toxin [Pseudonocardiaceae bacterium]